MSEQLNESIEQIISEARREFRRGVAVSEQKRVPSPHSIPAEAHGHKQHWLKIRTIISVVVDMKNSTLLSASKHAQGTASTYELYTGTAVDIFDDFDAAYIDVRGDGVVAIFDSQDAHRALAAAVTFKTFADRDFVPLVEDRTDVDVGSHCGIHANTVLVRRVGKRPYKGRSDRRNEVWAGKPVNMAAKLAADSKHDEILASPDFYNLLEFDEALYSCGCGLEGSTSLWTSVDIADDENFNFDTCYSLKSNWCKSHGKQYCQALIRKERNRNDTE